MRPKIYLFGDSITEESFADGGWGAALANHFSRTVDVVLRGYSGYNTSWASRVLEKVFPPELEAGNGRSPLAVTVFFGANDACLPDRCSAFQHVPLDEYKNNLHSIVSFFKGVASSDGSIFAYACALFNNVVVQKKWPGTMVLLITPPPIDEEARLLHPFIENKLGLPERTNEAAGAYAKACITVAGECGFPVVDLWAKMQQFPDWKKSFLSDGLHLNQDGNRIVYEEVIKALRVAGLSLENLPVDLPLIEDINPNDPLKSFEN